MQPESLNSVPAAAHLLFVRAAHDDQPAELYLPAAFCPFPCAGSIKRWGMKRGAMTHGSKSHREHGSTGPGTTPGRNFPGLKMAGHMGNVRRKVRSLQVLKVDLERKAIVVKGSVPGKPGNILEIAPAKVRSGVLAAGVRVGLLESRKQVAAVCVGGPACCAGPAYGSNPVEALWHTALQSCNESAVCQSRVRQSTATRHTQTAASTGSACVPAPASCTFMGLATSQAPC